jgi:hypothetical protein
MSVRSLVYARMVSALVAIVVLATLLTLPAAARASFTHAKLLSGTLEHSGIPGQQFENANNPAISQSGEYVAFQGSVGEEAGVWRRDPTGELQLVAGKGASGPSISKNGNYIAFTTGEDLDPWHEGPGGKFEGEPPGDVGCPEVYVRNMEVGEHEPGAYVLASALNESNEGIQFTSSGSSGSTCSGGGAEAADAVAMSALGNEVVFTVSSESNLAGAATPPGQVAVRNLQSKTTTLVTATPNGEPVPGGGAFPDAWTMRYGDSSGSTAAISAEGGTVAWFGMNVAAQVSSAEAAREPALGSEASGSEVEPLWRRVTGGAGTNTGTRRLLAGAQLAFFAPDVAGEPPTAVEAGAFIGTPPYGVPALSENGETVAVLADAPPQATLASVIEAQRRDSIDEYDADAYVVHVTDNPAVPPQVTPLTQVTSYFAQRSNRESVTQIAISPDGSRVAFDTERTPLESPSLADISPPTKEQVDDIYEANVEAGTLQRVTSSYDGGEVNESMGLVSFANDQTLTFASDATDLFYGDDVDAAEVYEINEIPSSEQVVPPQVSQAPALVLPEPEWTLSATAVPQTNGSVLVYAQVPGAGRLGVEAQAQLPVQPTSRVRSKTVKRARKAKRSEAPARAAVVGKLATRTVARAGATATSSTEVIVRVSVGAAYRRLLDDGDGLYALLRVTFTAPDHALLVREIPVTLRDGKAQTHTTGKARRLAKKAKGRERGGKRGAHR